MPARMTPRQIPWWFKHRWEFMSLLNYIWVYICWGTLTKAYVGLSLYRPSFLFFHCFWFHLKYHFDRDKAISTWLSSSTTPGFHPWSKQFTSSRATGFSLSQFCWPYASSTFVMLLLYGSTQVLSSPPAAEPGKVWRIKVLWTSLF